MASGQDPTYTKAYADVLANVRNDNNRGQNVDFFVSQRDGSVNTNTNRRQGVNMGDIGGQFQPVEDIEDEDNIDQMVEDNARGGDLGSNMGDAGEDIDDVVGYKSDNNDGEMGSDEDLINDLGDADDDDDDAPNLA